MKTRGKRFHDYIHNLTITKHPVQENKTIPFSVSIVFEMSDNVNFCSWFATAVPVSWCILPKVVWAAQSAFAVMSPLVHTRAKCLNVWFSRISCSLIHISVVVLCCSCFHTMPRAGWMLSKCGFTWAIKWAVLFLCCSDTSVGAAFKGIIGLFCSFIYWNAAQFLSLTLKFLSIISCDSFLQSFSLWTARIIFIFSIFVFPWNQILSLAMMVVYLPFLPIPAVLLFAAARKKPQKTPHLPGSLETFTVH